MVREMGRKIPSDRETLGQRVGRIHSLARLLTWKSEQLFAPREQRESVNARYAYAVKARGHFPTEQAAIKCLYLVTRSPGPTGKGRVRWAARWKPALNAFAITFADRFPAAEKY